MAAEARPHHSARAIPRALPLPGFPCDGTIHLVAAPNSLRPRPRPLSGCPSLFSPEVDITDQRRGRGGGGSASGEAGPGLVFVNLSRSRWGQRWPRCWHSVLGSEGGVARLVRQLEAVPGRFLKQIVNFAERIQLENQDWHTLQTIGRSQAESRNSWIIYLPFGGH